MLVDSSAMRVGMGDLSRRCGVARRAFVVSLLLLVCCFLACDDSAPLAPVPPPIDSPEKLVQTLARAYDEGDAELFATLLANDPANQAEYAFRLAEPTPYNETEWGYDEEARLHRRMFDPAHPDPADPPVPTELWLENLTILLTSLTEFVERPEWYTTNGGLLDDSKWKATSATYTTYLLFELAGATDYRVEGEAAFVVLEDLDKEAGAAGKFLLLVWEDLGQPLDHTAAVSVATWSQVKDLYRPHPAAAVIRSDADVIEALARAYQSRDPALLASLLANDADHAAEFLFLLNDPTPENETQWGYAEEARIHQRMFRPESPLPGDTPVPPDLWPQALQITLSPITRFTERTDLYLEAGGTLDPEKWRATAARYATYLLFELVGEIDYRVDGEAFFIVVEDLEKQIGDPGKFRILIWEDLGSPAATTEGADPGAGMPVEAGSASTWSWVKSLYR